eukprot:2104946-Pyramimonas_sp.AAC.2
MADPGRPDNVITLGWLGEYCERFSSVVRFFRTTDSSIATRARSSRRVPAVTWLTVHCWPPVCDSTHDNAKPCDRNANYCNVVQDMANLAAQRTQCRNYAAHINATLSRKALQGNANQCSAM